MQLYNNVTQSEDCCTLTATHFGSVYSPLKSNLTPKPLFTAKKIKAKKYSVVFLIDSGLNLHILV